MSDVAKIVEEMIDCPECKTEISLKKVEQDKKCPKCGAIFELEYEPDNEYEEESMQENEDSSVGELPIGANDIGLAKSIKPSKKQNEDAINVVRQKFLAIENIQEVVHDTYVSWYKDGNKAKGKKGKRFFVAYRHGRSIKAQLFTDNPPEVEGLRPINADKGIYEFKTKSFEDFEKFIDLAL